MAKLNDLIKRATRPDPEPMGFGAAARKLQPSILLAALVGDHWSRAVGEAIAAGANIIVLQGKPGERDIAEAVDAAGDAPGGSPATTHDARRSTPPRRSATASLCMGDAAS